MDVGYWAEIYLQITPHQHISSVMSRSPFYVFHCLTLSPTLPLSPSPIFLCLPLLYLFSHLPSCPQRSPPLPFIYTSLPLVVYNQLLLFLSRVGELSAEEEEAKSSWTYFTVIEREIRSLKGEKGGRE